MSLLLLSNSKHRAINTRSGLVRSNGQAVLDDDGTFHPLGLTFFWALYGWKYERTRVLDHLEWISQYNFDYLRILGEVDWPGRSIEPSWPDYSAILQDFVDTAYDDYGLRTELTIVGGRKIDKNTGKPRFVPTELARMVAQAMKGRENKIMHYECANEWSRLDKVSMQDLIDMTRVLRAETPNLVALSCPNTGKPTHDEPSGYEAMRVATAQAGGNMFTLHLRRSDHDYKWSAVRQGYDLKDFPHVASNNEGQGLQSSVDTLDNPLQLACYRALGVICGGGPFVLHVGQGVTGKADPTHGRPENMWDVPYIDPAIKAVSGVDDLLPAGIENWRVVNNGRDDHPLPLDDKLGFWEGEQGRAPAVNKNYAAYNHDEFRVALIGCRSANETGPVPAGIATRDCHVEAFDPATMKMVAWADLKAGQAWTVPGRHDTMAGYIIKGQYV